MNCLDKLVKAFNTFNTSVFALVISLVFFSVLSFAKDLNQPSIIEPRLSYLSTNNGLDQDTINDLYVDKQGFMWVATEEGLNRFDGAKVLKINGLNNELESVAIYSIYEHSSGLLLIGTDNMGILTLNKETQEVKKLFAKPYEYAPDWLEYGVGFVEDSNANVVFAFDQSIHRINLTTNESEELFYLAKEKFEAGVHIRAIFLVGNKLFVATNLGLTAVDTDTLERYSIYGNTGTSENVFNVKFLASFNEKDLLVGTVEGLYKFSIGELLNHIELGWNLPSPTTIIEKRNIWDIAKWSNDTAYIGTDIGLFQLNLENFSYQYMFKPIRGYEVLSTLDVKTVAVDGNQNIWFGTPNSGAMLWSPKSLSFTNIYNAVFSQQDEVLSSNIVWSIYQYDPETVFIGTNRGLNKFDLATNNIEQFKVDNKNQLAFSESEIQFITSTERGYLWLNTTDGVRYYSIAEKSIINPPFKSQEVINLLSEFAYSVFFEGKEKIWLLGLEYIFVIDRDSEKISRIDLSTSDLNISYIHALIGKDNKTNTLLIAGTSELWGINLDTLTLSLLHSIKHENAKSSIHPTQFVRGHDNTAWLVYAGFGMYKLNGTTLHTIESYSTRNVLPSNLIYGLSIDAEGVLWFSSHSGIHAFDPVLQSTKSFGVLNGLATSEFNQGANTNLTDGRLAYGGNLGFTMFQPSKLKANYSNVDHSPVITEVQLNTRELILPLTSLNDATINLKHSDNGLSIFFSALSFDQHLHNRFNYRIISKGEVVTYPTTVGSNKIVLPSLPSGQHTIEIYPRAKNGETRAARLYVNVSYPTFLSPTAYVSYAFIAVLLISIFYTRRRRTQKIVEHANTQVQLYNKRLTDALKASNSNIWEWDSSNNQMRSERIATELTEEGHSDRIEFHEYVEKIHENDRLSFISAWKSFLNKEQSDFDISYRIWAEDGKLLWYRDLGSLNETDAGVIEVKGTYTNITQTVAAQDKLKLFGNAFKHTRDWVLIFDKNKRLIATNPSFMKAFGISEHSEYFKLIENSDIVLAQQQSDLKSAIDRLSLMKPGERFKTESHIEIQGNKMTLLTDINAVVDEAFPERIDFYLIIATDITEQINAQKELQELVNKDRLTGLINRNLLIERLKHSIHSAYRHSSRLAVLFIDLDRFKPINDSFGHEAGDVVLSEVAARIRAKFTKQDSVARIGGDEFVVIIDEANDVEALNRDLDDLLASIEKPISIAQQFVIVSASIGIAMYPDDATDADLLIRNADIAMFCAKEKGKNGYQYYKKSMTAAFARLDDGFVDDENEDSVQKASSVVHFIDPSKESKSK